MHSIQPLTEHTKVTFLLVCGSVTVTRKVGGTSVPSVRTAASTRRASVQLVVSLRTTSGEHTVVLRGSAVLSLLAVGEDAAVALLRSRLTGLGPVTAQALADSGGDGVVAVHLSAGLSSTFSAAAAVGRELGSSVR